jgi:hypothetical protein
VVLGVVVLLAAGVALVPRLIDQHPTGRASPQRAPTSTASPSQTIAADEVKARLNGPLAALPAGLVVAVGGPKPAVTGRGTGPVFALDRLPLQNGDVVASVTPVPAGLLVVVQTVFAAPAKHFSKIYLVGVRGTVLLTRRRTRSWSVTVRIGSSRCGPGTDRRALEPCCRCPGRAAFSPGTRRPRGSTCRRTPRAGC